MKVGDIVKFKRGRSHYQQRGYEVGDGTIPTQTYPAHMRGKLAIITEMAYDSATEVYMMKDGVLGGNVRTLTLPYPNYGSACGLVEGDDLEVISSGADQ